MEPAHSPFGLVGQIARDTGWSVDYIMRGVNYPMLMLMWQDFPPPRAGKEENHAGDGCRKEKPQRAAEYISGGLFTTIA